MVRVFACIFVLVQVVDTVELDGVSKCEMLQPSYNLYRFRLEQSSTESIPNNMGDHRKQDQI